MNTLQTASLETEIQQYFPLVQFAIKRYRRKLDQDDLFQLGCLGLLKAIRNFNAGLGFQFSTYAVAMIRGEVIRFLTRENHLLKASRHIRLLANRIRRFQLDHCPIDEIAERLNCSLIEAERALAYANLKIVSLHYFYEDETTLQDAIPCYDDQSQLYVQEFINSLSNRDRQIVALRVQENSQSSIAKKVGISQVQISRTLKSFKKQYQEAR